MKLKIKIESLSQKVQERDSSNYLKKYPTT